MIIEKTGYPGYFLIVEDFIKKREEWVFQLVLDGDLLLDQLLLIV